MKSMFYVRGPLERMKMLSMAVHQ